MMCSVPLSRHHLFYKSCISICWTPTWVIHTNVRHYIWIGELAGLEAIWTMRPHKVQFKSPFGLTHRASPLNVDICLQDCCLSYAYMFKACNQCNYFLVMPRYLTSTSLAVQDLFQGDRSTTSTGSFWWIGCLASIERRHGPTMDLLFASQWVIQNRCVSTCMRVSVYAFACLYQDFGSMTIPWNLYHDLHMNPKTFSIIFPKKLGPLPPKLQAG